MNAKLKTTPLTEPYYLPKADVLETRQGYRILIDLPGVRKENLSVSLEQNHLSLKGTITPRGGKRKVREEYPQGHFKRDFKLSQSIDKKALIAQLENGVLSVKLRKKPSPEPLSIPVD